MDTFDWHLLIGTAFSSKIIFELKTFSCMSAYQLNYKTQQFIPDNVSITRTS